MQNTRPNYRKPLTGWAVAVLVLHLVLGLTTSAKVNLLLSVNKYYCLVALLSAALLFSYGQILRVLARTARQTSADFKLMFVIFFLCLSFLEIAFSLIPKSHSVGYVSLASRLWFKKYWSPVNSFGYRDLEPIPAKVAHRKKIFFVGDSFTAGHGLKNISERFSDIVGDALASKAVTMNLGVMGIDTQEEYRRLVSYPAKPDAIVLSYFGNDVGEAAAQAGIEVPQFTEYNLSFLAKHMVKRSYLTNYLYWQFPHQELRPFFDFLKAGYRSPKALSIHREDLKKFARYSKEQKIPLLVVIIPYLHAIPESSIYTDFVEKVFAEEGVPVIQIKDHLNGLDQMELTVNNNDAHASSAVNARIAQAILEKEAYLLGH